MPKYLPAKRQWKQVVDGYKLKDNGLAKLIDDFRDLREDEYDKRLAMLSQISKLADATRKSKEVIAAGSKVVKMLDDAIEAAAEIRKRVEADQREAQKVACTRSTCRSWSSEEVEWEGEAGLPSFKDFKKV